MSSRNTACYCSTGTQLKGADLILVDDIGNQNSGWRFHWTHLSFLEVHSDLH